MMEGVRANPSGKFHSKYFRIVANRVKKNLRDVPATKKKTELTVEVLNDFGLPLIYPASNPVIAGLQKVVLSAVDDFL